MTLDSSGNLGLGVTPSGWGGGIKVIEFGSIGGLAAATVDVNMLYNVYYDGVNRYRTNGYASNFQHQLGAFKWFTAASGNAGDPISFTQAMTLDASGNLLVGTTSKTAGGAGIVDIRGSLTLSAASAVNGGYQQIDFAAGVYVKAAIRGYSMGTTDAGELRFYTAPAGDIINERARIPAAGGMVVGTAALATTATDGFLYVPTCAGTPTGTPTTQTGTAPIVVDTTNNKLYFYSGGQWRDAGP
jgi:hypothetical protein